MNYQLDTFLTSLAKRAQEVLGVQEAMPVEPANPKFGADYAVPCFRAAKELGRNPAELAGQLANGLAQYAGVQKAEAAGPYVNLWLEPQALAEQFFSDTKNAHGQGKHYGEHDFGTGKTIVVEFPSTNLAKPFGVGHLRPAVQGWALSQIMRATGYNVITDDHLGDWGTPFGKWVVGFLRYSSDEALNEKGIYELARVYIQITADMKAEKEAGGHDIADEVQNWLLKLEQGDEEATRYSKRFRDISLEHIHRVYDRLGIHTDHALGEAFFVPEGKRMVAELIEKGIAKKQADGSVIVRLDEYSIDTPVLIQKSNGAAIYATTDMATVKYRMEHWHPDKIIHVVGAEQQFHFRQVFALADKLGYKTNFVHYWFGIIDQINEDGTRGKMSSRKGVVLLEELLDLAEQKAREHAADPSVLTDKAVKQIALGAIKFTDFAQDKKTPILFDWDRIFSLQGFSGPYIQYAAVRVGAILNKFGTGEWRESEYDWAAEHDVLLHLARYPQVVKDAAELLEPHRIAQYLYDLARILNRYYENTPVGTAEEPVRNLRLWLLGMIRQNFEHGLGLLGIEVPEKM